MKRKENKMSSIMLNKYVTLQVKKNLHGFILGWILGDRECMEVIKEELTSAESPNQILYVLKVVSAFALLSEELEYSDELHEDGYQMLSHLWDVSLNLVDILQKTGILDVLKGSKREYTEMGEPYYEII